MLVECEEHNQKFSELLNCNIDVEIFDFIELLNKSGCKTFECCQGDHNEKRWIILEKETFHKVKNLFPEIIIENGAYGYDLSDYHSEFPKDDLLITCIFK